ncbi:unnamed protein product [Parnassius apollo]|uniref:(apollo) hypothetical protein n=1 Tax=Parnassius apollo TaxID=110799 RepID=A0A8S3WKQ4_PARAO|nr:unnamed protein product [Parnassius apollo]
MKDAFHCQDYEPYQRNTPTARTPRRLLDRARNGLHPHLYMLYPPEEWPLPLELERSPPGEGAAGDETYSSVDVLVASTNVESPVACNLEHTPATETCDSEHSPATEKCDSEHSQNRNIYTAIVSNFQYIVILHFTLPLL